MCQRMGLKTLNVFQVCNHNAGLEAICKHLCALSPLLFLVYLPLMAQVLSVLTKKRSAAALIIALIYALFKVKSHFQRQAAATNNARKGSSSNNQQHRKGKSSKQRVGVNSHFLKQMRELLPICIPGTCKDLHRITWTTTGWSVYIGVFSKEAGLLGALATVLIARTWLDIWYGLNVCDTKYNDWLTMTYAYGSYLIRFSGFNG